MSLKLYLDDLSQPCRAVHILLEANKVPCEIVALQLLNRDNYKCEELQKISPSASLPVMNDNGFVLTESGAMLTYLVDKYNLPEHWYPKDLQKRAKIDEYLHWHHTFLRQGAGFGFFYKYVYRKMTGKEAEPVLVSECEETLKTSLTRLNDNFLKDSKFIYGEEISVADLQAVCEVTHIWMVGKRLEDDYPNVKRWMADCQTELGESFEKVHQAVYNARDSNVFMGGQKA